MVLQMLEVIDQSEEGEVDFDGFLDLMVARIDGRESQEEIVRIFELFDSNDRGYITVDDLARVVKELGENFTRKELDEMIERADLDQDGAINRQEFVNLMLKRVAD
jgi:Ca2+-binding EF-hand superfamily protein